MPSAAYWTAVDLVSRRTAPLEALYAVAPALPIMPATDDMLTMEPPPDSRIAGIAAFVPRKTPLPLMSMTRSQLSAVSVSTSPPFQIPALLT